jgi:hypothetical protein
MVKKYLDWLMEQAALRKENEALKKKKTRADRSKSNSFDSKDACNNCEHYEGLLDRVRSELEDLSHAQRLSKAKAKKTAQARAAYLGSPRGLGANRQRSGAAERQRPGSVTAELPRVPTAETSEGTEDEHVNIDTCLEAEERELERKHQEQLERLQSSSHRSSLSLNEEPPVHAPRPKHRPCHDSFNNLTVQTADAEESNDSPEKAPTDPSLVEPKPEESPVHAPRAAHPPCSSSVNSSTTSQTGDSDSASDRSPQRPSLGLSPVPPAGPKPEEHPVHAPRVQHRAPNLSWSFNTVPTLPCIDDEESNDRVLQKMRALKVDSIRKDAQIKRLRTENQKLQETVSNIRTIVR